MAKKLPSLRKIKSWNDIEEGECISSGLYGQLFKVKIKSKRYAMKKFRQDTRTTREDVLNEYNMMCKVTNHRNIVKVKLLYDWKPKTDEMACIKRRVLPPNRKLLCVNVSPHTSGHVQILPSIVMERCSTKNVRQLVRHPKSRMTPREKLKILYDVACGIEHLHDIGIVHGDIKPQNVVYSKKTDSYKICDFGSASLIHEFNNKKLQGTAWFIGPELPLGHKINDPRLLDVYAFGIFMWCVWSTTDINTNDHDMTVLKKTAILNERPSISKIHDSTPIGVARLAKKCWRKNPHKRPQTFSVIKRKLVLIIDELYNKQSN